MLNFILMLHLFTFNHINWRIFGKESQNESNKPKLQNSYSVIIFPTCSLQNYANSFIYLYISFKNTLIYDIYIDLEDGKLKIATSMQIQCLLVILLKSLFLLSYNILYETYSPHIIYIKHTSKYMIKLSRLFLRS